MAKTVFSNTLVTKALVLQAIEDMVKNIEGGYTPNVEAYELDGVGVTYGDIVEYCEKTREQLADKAAKAKTYASKRKVEGDEFRAKVKAVLTTDKAMTREEVLKFFEEDPDITIAKVGARLTQLVKAGEVEKTEEKFAGGNKKMTYKLVG